MKTNYYPVSFRLDKELVDKLREAAKKDHRSMTNLLELIVMKWLEENNK